MLASSRTPQRRHRSAVALTTGVLLLALAGCSGDSPPEQPSPEPTAEATPLADFDTSDLTLVRDEFCDRVDAGAIAAALDAESTNADAEAADVETDTESWRPGRRLPGSRDISNEFGCSWSTASATARAWVFAPPISRERAGDFAKESVGRGCQRLDSAPPLGEPGVAQRCGKGGDPSTSFHGLVGDAWVGCEVSGDPGTGGDGVARVGEWCVAVLQALRAT